MIKSFTTFAKLAEKLVNLCFCYNFKKKLVDP